MRSHAENADPALPPLSLANGMYYYLQKMASLSSLEFRTGAALAAVMALISAVSCASVDDGIGQGRRSSTRFLSGGEGCVVPDWLTGDTIDRSFGSWPEFVESI